MMLSLKSQKGKASLFYFSVSVKLLLLSALLVPSICLSEQLYAYKSARGTLTFTSRKPAGKSYYVVSPKVPQKSVFYYHRGLGYSTSSKPKPSAFDSAIIELAKEHNVEAALIKAVMHVESAFNPRAVSSAGARGLMQLMPATAKRFGVSDAFHAIDNMNGGVKYLKWLYNRFEGNLRNVLAGYNAGEGAVDQYGGVPPYKETVDYVSKVMDLHRMYRSDFAGLTNLDKKSTGETSRARLGKLSIRSDINNKKS
jgi:hypothetical protein